LIKTLRKAIRYQVPGVSPFERPLTSAELDRFGSRFSRQRVRAFSLPFVNLTQACPRFDDSSTNPTGSTVRF
jgi:hypothetical protein